MLARLPYPILLRNRIKKSGCSLSCVEHLICHPVLIVIVMKRGYMMSGCVRKGQVLVPALVVIMLMLAAMIVGCGGGPTQSSIEGYWLVEPQNDSEKEIKEKGVFTIYQFEGDNTFRLIAHIRDSEPLVRTGTYEIKQGKVYVSLPEMESSLGTAKSIENGEVTIQGDTLTTTAIATDGGKIVAKKITDEQYKNELDAAAALGPKRIAVGESVTTPTAAFIVDSIAFVDEIYPSDTSGYYQYMSKQSGSSYLLAVVSYTNPGTEYEVPGYSTKASFSVGGNIYEAEIEVDAGSRFGASYRVEAKEATHIYIYCSVPDTVKEAGEVKLTWSIPNEQSYMTAYYKPSFPQDEFSVTMQ